MPLQIIRSDITKIACDAVVTAASAGLLPAGLTGEAVHRAAGPELLRECRSLGSCRAGGARVTKAYRLPCKYVIHTVTPHWYHGKQHSQKLLESCYCESLEAAREHACRTVAFPLLSGGAFGAPKDQALRMAVHEIAKFLLYHEMLVYVVIYDRDYFPISRELLDDIQSYVSREHIDHIAEYISGGPENFPDEGTLPAVYSLEETGPEPDAGQPPLCSRSVSEFRGSLLDADLPCPAPAARAAPAMAAPPDLVKLVNQIDESFSQMLLRKIDEKGMTDAECYKKANIDRKLFSKIRSDVNYRPSKITAIAFAVALELSLEETCDMLMKAGFALSHSNKFDIIIEYFIRIQNYDIFQINEALLAFDQSLLGLR